MKTSSSISMVSISISTTKLLLLSLTIPASLLVCLLLLSSTTTTSPPPPLVHLTIPPPTTTNFSVSKTPNASYPAVSPTTHFSKPPTASYPAVPPTTHFSKPTTHFSKPTTHFSKPTKKDPECDVYDGRWVFDESYPLYQGSECPYVDEGFSCQLNGRADADYLKWRWQPNGCDLPRFNAVRMLERLRGKRLVFVGDSINRNQWESMLCLLRSGVTDPSRIREARGRKITKEKGNYNFKFMDYGCSVEYYVSHYLVHEGKGRVGKKRTKTLRIDRIDRSSSRWRGADILVFNTAHWWSHYKTKAGVNYYQEGDQIHPQLNVNDAFRKALITWGLWIDQHATPGKTEVFFRSSSPSHFSGGEWNSGGHCKESSQPLNTSSVTVRPNNEKTVIVEQVIRQMRTRVTLLSITNLSGLRIDAHPSVYGRSLVSGTKTNTEDCSHWCLPGLPDVWNELLYFNLVTKQKPVLTS